ncbi:hypothetical protein IFM47457_05212 [Aspergillus lentulus]|nr:hypothetical protein IFM47457_05212 [Aspergillus lentulus]
MFPDPEIIIPGSAGGVTGGGQALPKMSVVEDREAASFGSKLAVVFDQRGATRRLLVVYWKDS